MSLNELARIHFFISNRNRVANENPCDFRVNLPAVSEFASTFYIAVHSVTFENRIPIIQENVNDLLSYTYNGVDGEFVFSAGNYDAYDLRESLEQALQTLNAGFTVDFDASQLKMILNIPAGVTFSIRLPNYVLTTGRNYTYPSRNERFLELLGWTFHDSYILSFEASSTFVPNDIVRLRTSTFLHLNIKSINVQSSISSSAMGYKTIARVPLADYPFGQMAHYSYQTLDAFPIGINNFDSLEFFLTDEWDLPVQVDGNMLFAFHFSLTPASF